MSSLNVARTRRVEALEQAGVQPGRVIQFKPKTVPSLRRQAKSAEILLFSRVRPTPINTAHVPLVTAPVKFEDWTDVPLLEDIEAFEDPRELHPLAA